MVFVSDAMAAAGVAQLRHQNEEEDHPHQNCSVSLLDLVRSARLYGKNFLSRSFASKESR